MRLRAVLALVVLAAVAALIPIAYASTADPTWIGGFWDDDDHDDVVLLAMGSAEGVTPGSPVVAFSSHVLDVVSHDSPRSLATGGRASPAIRAPPVA